MNFENAYQKYVNGTATAEEIAFVEKQIEESKKLTEIIDKIDESKQIIAEPNIKEIRRVKKKYEKKKTIITVFVSMLVFFLSAGVVCAGVFGKATACATKNVVYDATSAKSIAIQYVRDNFSVPAETLVFVNNHEIDKELSVQAKLENSVYIYEIEVQTGSGMEIDLIVSSKTGLVSVLEVSTH